MSLPATEFYVFGAKGEPALFSAWGYDFFAFMAFRLGHAFLNFLQAFLFSLPLWVFFLTGKQAPTKEEFYWRLLLTVLIGVICAFPYWLRIYYRPEVTYYAIAALSLALARQRLIGGIKIDVLNIGMIALLGNLHTTAPILAFVLLVVRTAGAPDESIKIRSGNLHYGALRACLYGAAIFLNPYGQEQALNQILSNFESIKAYVGAVAANSGGISGQPGGSANLEYLPSFEVGYGTYWIILVSFAALAASISRNKLSSALLCVPFMVMSFLHNRYVGLLAFQCVVMGSYLVNGAAERLSGRDIGKQISDAKAIALALLLLAVPLLNSLADGSWGLGDGSGKGIFPERGLNKIQVLEKEGSLKSKKLFSFWHMGPWIVWNLGQGWSVAMDGHFTKQTKASVLYEEILNGADSLDIMDRENVSVAFLPSVVPYMGAPVPLANKLARSDKWKLVSSEPAGMFFARVAVPSGMQEKEKEYATYLAGLMNEAKRIYLSSPVLVAKKTSLETMKNAETAFNKLAGAEQGK